MRHLRAYRQHDTQQANRENDDNNGNGTWYTMSGILACYANIILTGSLQLKGLLYFPACVLPIAGNIFSNWESQKKKSKIQVRLQLILINKNC